MRKRTMAIGLLGLSLAAQAPGQLIIFHPGSISTAFKAVEARFTERTGVQITDVAGGSVSIARKVTAGGRPCDVFASADYELIEQMLKPAGYADFTLRIAEGAMVLAYTTASRNAATIAAPGPFNPPEAIPGAAPDWYRQLCQPGVKINGGHPFLDPGAYRADLIMRLAQAFYQVPNLYDDLATHYVIAGVPGGLGKAYDYQFTYEHGARAAAKADTTGTYRYLRLPDAVSMGSGAMEQTYAKVGIPMPGLQSPGAAATVTIPATRVTWGATLMKAAPNRDNALAFLKLLCSPEGAALMSAAGGPTPIQPPVVSKQDFPHVPDVLKPLVRN